MMEEYVDLVPVEGHSNLGREKNSNAIINMDQTGYDAYIQAREKQKLKNKELEELKSDIEELKSLVKGLAKQIDK